MSWELGISITSIVIAGTSLGIGTVLALRGRKDSKDAHELTKKYHGFEARQKIDDTVNSLEMNITKSELVDEYFRLEEMGNEKIIFSNSPPEIRKYVLRLENAFNKVCSWYQKEDWVDREDFEEVIGGYVVNTWYLLKDEIENHRTVSDNPKFCRHFSEVALEFEKKGHGVKLYDMKKVNGSQG